MVKRVFLVFLTLAPVVCVTGAALADMTFYAAYNGNTGNGGLDADIGLGGTARTGTSGSPTLIAPGKYGSGLDADYTADEFRGNDAVYYNGGANVPASGTVALWVKLAWTPPQQLSPDQYYFFTARSNDYNNGVAMGVIYGNLPVFFSWSGGTAYENWAANIETGSNWDGSVLFSPWRAGEWHHLAMTWGSGGIKAYGDGVLWRTVPAAPMTAIPESLTVGKALGNSSGDAVIDDFMIWNVELTLDELKQVPGIPEPSSLLALLTGAVALGGIALRRRGR